MIAICKVKQTEGNFKDKFAKSDNKVVDIHESATVGIEKRLGDRHHQAFFNLTLLPIIS